MRFGDCALKSDELGKASYYGIKKSTASMDACRCCGNPSANIVMADGFPGMATIALCSFCEGAHFETVDGYLQVVCPFHDIPDIAAMVYYWKSIEIFNEKTGEKKRGKRVTFGVDWTAELEKLRTLYKKGEPHKENI